MPLTKNQTDKIDELITSNAKRPDIVNELVGKMHADAREVDQYLKQNKTLQSMLNTITRGAKEILSAGTEAERKKIVKKIETLAKRAIKLLQRKAGQ
jgi:hypothetical protein